MSLGAYEHQDLPFERLVDELAPERDPSRSPLFQVAFSMQNAPGAPLRLSGLTLRPFEQTAQSAFFDLQLNLAESPTGVEGDFVYNTDLFDDATIERMAGHFRTLLEGIAADPTARLSRLPLLHDAERRHVLSVGGDGAATYPVDVRVHERFEQQAARTPDATALVYEDQRLSYAELNARANRLAHHLRERGVGPEVLVGLCVERSLEQVVAILGVLKAGGAYVPLDPGYPKQRLSFILDDSRTPILLTQSHLAGDLPDEGGEVVCLDTDAAAIGQQPETNPAPVGTTGDTAYVIYTSGSTGTPKGGATSGRCSTPARSTSRCGRSGARCSTAGVWSSCRTRSADRRRTSTRWCAARA
jgi:non-ribosomal peptide synthetase component F